MHLDNISFRFNFEKDRFTYLSYSIEIPLDPEAEKKEIVSSIQKGFSELESLLDKEFVAAKKSKVGEMDEDSVEYGFKYKEDTKDMKKEYTVNLKYKMFLEGDRIRGMSLHVFHLDDDEGRLLRLYEKILGLYPKMSKNAYSSKEKIEALRNGMRGESLIQKVIG